MDSIRKQARVAGGLYLLIAITAPVGLMVVPDALLVAGDATATADRIRASEWLLRLGIASELFHQVIMVFLVFALFRLFRPVSETYAAMLAVFSLLGLPIVFASVVHEIAALLVIRGPEFLSLIDPALRDAQAYLLLRMHAYGITIASIFWGLWLFPFGILVLRSGFIPRFLGILLFLAGVGYLASAFTTLVLPAYAPAVNRVAMVLEFAEIPIIFWLLLWGAKEQRSAAPPA